MVGLMVVEKAEMKADAMVGQMAEKRVEPLSIGLERKNG